MSTIVVIDDHTLFREGLVSLLQKDDTLHVVGQASDGNEGLNLIEKQRPDIAMVDLKMPALDGYQMFEHLQNRKIPTRVIILTRSEDVWDADRAMRLGVHGYLLKVNAFDELMTGIRTVLAGKQYLSAAIAAPLVNLRQSDQPEAKAISPRERAVLSGVARGKTTKEIASELYLSVGTVKTYRTRLMEKLDLHTAADLTRYAIKQGLA
ncbi:MAG: response regulator transcription factor [Verrucomicrobiota bacterium]